jgi:hypothetical protein
MLDFRVFWGASVGALVFACGGAKPPTTAAPTATMGAPGAEEPPASLTPVPAPPELFAVARLANPARVADAAVRWSSLPLDWRTALAKESPGIERVLTMSEPVDFAAMLDPTSPGEPRAFWAFAFGVASVDAAAGFFRQNGKDVSRDRGGAYRIHSSDMTCLATAALGGAPARVVCSDESKAVDALAPYMTRGLPNERFGESELHAHVSAEPFQKRYGAQLGMLRTVGVPFALRELELDHPKFDRALRDVLYGVADELIALGSDVDRLDVDAAYTPDGEGLDASVSLALTGHKSWTGDTLTRAAAYRGSPPEFFFRLPEDSMTAAYSAYSDPEHVRAAARALRELVDGFLDYEKLPDARRTPLVDALEESMASGARSAHALLPLPPARGVGAGSDADGQAALRAAVGEHLVIVDRAGDSLTRLASELVKSLSDRTFREHLTQAKLLPPGEMPTFRERGPHDKELPKGSKVFEAQIPGEALAAVTTSLLPASSGGTKAPKGEKGKGAPPLSIVLLAVPDGPLTWFGLGTDEKDLSHRIREARAGNGATLALREGLGDLRTENSVSAGFMSLAGFLGQIDLPSIPRGAALDRLPHKGQTPIVWRLVLSADGPRATSTARLTKGVIEDLVALMASEGAPLAR